MSGRQRAQPVLACARCYSLKKKCDKKLPSCSRCALSGKECVGIDRHSRREVPRSVLQYLEKRLAEIEGDQGRRPEPGNIQPETERTVANTTRVSQYAYSKALQTMSLSIRDQYTTSCVGSNSGLLHESKLFYPTERPPVKVPVHGMYYEYLGKRAGFGNESQFPEIDALRIPFEVARQLFDNYVISIQPRFPCFTSSELWYHFEQVYSRQQQNDLSFPDPSCFIVSMVLAVSCLTSRLEDFSRVASMSESLYRDAMRHWKYLKHSNIESLQGLLLLIQLGLWLPYINNVFFLNGEAVRMAIGLGLHQEVDPIQGLSPRDVSLRRRVFWMVYLIDRTISISTGTPPCVSDEHITTCLPSDGEEGNRNADFSTSFTDGRLNAKQFLLQIQLCRLQSEIYEIKFFDRAIPDHFPSHDSWVQHMEERISSMLNLSDSSDGIVPQWIVNSAYHSQNLLHRPYPGNMVPSHASLLAATTSAISLIDGYHKVFRAPRLNWTFVVVNNAFQAAIVLLYIFGNYGHIVREAFLESELLSSLDKLMAIFDIGEQGWPVTATTRLYIQDLRDLVFSNEAGPLDSGFDLKLLSELELLLSQRRIRSIYQANAETQHAFLSGEPPSPHEYSQWRFSDDMWQEFIGAQFDLEEAYSLNFLDSFWLAQEPLPLLTSTANATNEISSPELPKDIEDAINSMPSCSFCRDQHIRCDRVFPCCGGCQRSRRECLYYDLLLSQQIPRKTIHHLIQRITAASQPVATRQDISLVSSLPSESVPVTYSELTWGINLLIPTAATSKNGSGRPHSEPRFSLPAINQDYMFFGVSSHLASINPVMHRLAEYTPAVFGGESSAGSISESSTLAVQVNRPDISTASRLFAVFYRSVHVWYPVMYDDSLQGLLSCCYTRPLDSYLDHNQELFYLILAISSQLTKRAEHWVGFTPAAYFDKATSNADTACDHPSGPSTLHLMQRSLLICIYLLLSPSAGDIWRNLGFAIRLYFDMSHGHSENLHDLNEAHLTMLARTLYCIEGKVTTALGRPTVLITGDKLRDELTQPLSGTIEERVSIHFYRISTMKMQIQSLLLSETSMQRNPDKLKEECETFRRELLQWHQSWKTDFISAITTDLHDWRGAVQYLEAWANLQYNASILMLSRFSSETAENVFKAIREIVSCCRLLARQHQHSFMAINRDDIRQQIPVFPVDWTISHLLFSAGLHLVSSEKQDTVDHSMWERTVRSCLATMASMEADPANMSAGFSEILEGLYI